MSLSQSLEQPVNALNHALDKFQSPLLLIFRLWIGKVFFMSGLQKISTWNDEYGVMYLFREEYNVPLLDPVVAAYMATAGELILPVFIVLGFGTRYAAIALSILNFTAAYSYYDTLAKVGQVTPHIFWGSMLLTIIIFGPGFFSIDQWIKQKMGR